MLIDSRSDDAGDESPILDFNGQTNTPSGSGSRSASTAARRSASNDDASGVSCRKRPHTEQETQMSRRKSSNPSDYEVGYGRPPRETRFQPGQSGNPTGYRKGSKPIRERLRELMNSKVTVTEHGRTRRVSRLDVMLRQLANDAMRGDQRALKLLMEFVHRYGSEAEGTVRPEEITSEDLEILSNYLEKTRSSDSDSNDSRKEGDDDDGESL